MGEKRVMTSDGGFTLEGVTRVGRKRYSIGAEQGTLGMGISTSNASPWPKTVANNTSTKLALTISAGGGIQDPTGIWQDEAYDGSTPAESWGRLPPGLWIGFLGAHWEHHTTGTRDIGIDVIDDRIATPGLDDLWCDPWYLVTVLLGNDRDAATLTGDYAFSTRLIAVTEAMVNGEDAKSDAGEGWAVGAKFYQNSGGELDVTAVDLSLVKIGEAA